MGPGLVIQQQEPIEIEGWPRIDRTDHCSRCGGLMVAEWCEDLSDYAAQRCVQCGELIDPVIMQNRRLSSGRIFKR